MIFAFKHLSKKFFKESDNKEVGGLSVWRLTHANKGVREAFKLRLAEYSANLTYNKLPA